MKKLKDFNLPIYLQSLGIVFLMLFAMAFACKNADETSTTDSDRQTTQIGRRGSGTDRRSRNLIFEKHL